MGDQRGGARHHVRARADASAMRTMRQNFDGLTIDLTDPTDRAAGERRPDLPGFPTVSVVVPTLNEAKNLPLVLPLIPGWVDEILIVDGGSTDDTVAVCQKLVPHAKIIIEPARGKGLALQTGFHAASCDIIVAIDADGSTRPSEIPAYVGALMAGADMVKGSRFLQGGGTDDMEWHRKAGNWGLTRLVRVGFGGRYTDLCYGYFAFWRRVLPELSDHNDEAHGFEIETFINIRALTHGLKVTEVASFESDRVYGQSNLNTFRDGFRVLRTIGREFVTKVRS